MVQCTQLHDQKLDATKDSGKKGEGKIKRKGLSKHKEGNGRKKNRRNKEKDLRDVPRSSTYRVMLLCSRIGPSLKTSRRQVPFVSQGNRIGADSGLFYSILFGPSDPADPTSTTTWFALKCTIDATGSMCAVLELLAWKLANWLFKIGPRRKHRGTTGPE